ncbi:MULTISPECIES: nucleotide sugar dehydrogenase [Corynebacterium]|uniref:Nucleotide sugar dehydrogenase family protein n=1 Tax=Corynebacterium simulans TaxID=146827 RepID=A0ABR5V923_9CORY|nr:MULTISPECIES: nucleotide sugar dehydrogenase [Corynebacterium]KXU17701.1 nucleotide sugar dehydrogenase family protein [Corynebacterium simulans]OFR39374.1 hypothetical protein HMPREF2888_08550 [Corynebacterium sp. HMSC077D03]
MADFDLCVMGLGYVGLPTAAIFAHEGLSVLGVDVSEQRLDIIRSGHSDDAEPGLNEFVQESLTAGRLQLAVAPSTADVFIIAVPTPVTPEQGYDNTHVLSAAKAIAPYLVPGGLVVLESTIPPGATEGLADAVKQQRSRLGLDPEIGLKYAHCPERVLPGNVLHELYHNDRVVGGIDDASTVAAEELYSRFCKGDILKTTVRTAELTKVVENSYRDVNIAFANEISMVAAKMGVDETELVRLANQHPRVNILTPGIGVGGHCISVDPWFVISAFPDDTALLRTAREVNESKTQWAVARLSRAIVERRASKVALMGLAYKPNIGDLRNSPALKASEALAMTFPDVEFQVLEPHITGLEGAAHRLGNMPNVHFSSGLDGIGYVDCAIRLVRHQVFDDLSLEKWKVELLEYDGTLSRE